MSYIDKYGVNHDNFTIRDELDYQYKIKKSQEDEKNNFTRYSKELLKQLKNWGSVLGAGVQGAGKGIYDLGEDIYNLGYDAGERLYSNLDDKFLYSNRSSLGKAQAMAQKLYNVPISDVNKHQYVSCIGARDGVLPASLTLGAGIGKEVTDLYTKLRNKRNNPRYYNKMDVIRDSFKDLGNDVRGAWNGLNADDDDDCRRLLPTDIRDKY